MYSTECVQLWRLWSNFDHVNHVDHIVDIVDILDVVDGLNVLDVEVVSASIERRTISFQRATKVETLTAAVRVSPVSLVLLVLLVSLVCVNDMCPSESFSTVTVSVFRLDELYRCSLRHTLRHFVATVCGSIKRRPARFMLSFRLSSISLITIAFFWSYDLYTFLLRLLVQRIVVYRVTRVCCFQAVSKQYLECTEWSYVTSM